MSIDPGGPAKFAGPSGRGLARSRERSLDVKRPGGSREPEGQAPRGLGTGWLVPLHRGITAEE